MNSALLDFYRCPEGLIQTSISGDLSNDSRHFYFGGETLCYGQTAGVPKDCLALNGFPDLSGIVGVCGSGVRLPFDASEIVENLRRERYMANSYADGRDVLLGSMIRDIYYLFRPLMNIGVRKHLQRFALRRWEELPFPEWPVDTTVERFMERLLILSMKAQDLDEVPFIWFWPEGASSCAMVTHDVETEAGLRFVPALMGIDESAGIPASFQIVPQGRYATSQAMLDMIRDRGFEINVHDLSHDGELFRSKENLLRGAARVNHYLQEFGTEGFRSARMLRNADWLNVFEIAYDMSIPNVAHLEPQRGGCCTIFPYFIGAVLELPLTTIQDYSLFHILGDYSIGLWKKQIDLIRARHGLISVLVHPDYVYNNPRGLSLYRELLNHLERLRDSDRLWIAAPGEVNRWWRERSQMKLALENGHWRIVGEGHARARIAYLGVESDRAVYRVDEQTDAAFMQEPWERSARLNCGL
jgi:hypothetical protein